MVSMYQLIYPRNLITPCTKRMYYYFTGKKSEAQRTTFLTFMKLISGVNGLHIQAV